MVIFQGILQFNFVFQVQFVHIGSIFSIWNTYQFIEINDVSNVLSASIFLHSLIYEYICFIAFAFEFGCCF
jgi:hypothetical protein